MSGDMERRMSEPCHLFFYIARKEARTVKCLIKWDWIKIQRDEIPHCAKGIMIYYLRLVSRAAFRKGTARYCGYTNAVEVGTWVGGVVGLKKILKAKTRREALEIMDELQMLGYITYTLEPSTKILTYRITDWIVKYSGAECSEGDNIYTTPDYGFLCMPRNITHRLVEMGHKFGEADAWLDLWCHTVFRDKGNAFSFLAPAVQYGKYGSVLTLETLGKRWGWEKTKVWRFFQKYYAYFPLHRLPGSYGCVIFCKFYPSQDEIEDPTEEEIMRILELIRIKARNTHTEGTDNERINRFVAWKSRKVIKDLEDECIQEEIQNESEKSSDFRDVENSRVAEIPPIIRAYFSHGRNCMYSSMCIYDCSSIDIEEPESSGNWDIGVLRPFDGFPFFDLNTS